VVTLFDPSSHGAMQRSFINSSVLLDPLILIGIHWELRLRSSYFGVNTYILQACVSTVSSSSPCTDDVTSSCNQTKSHTHKTGLRTTARKIIQWLVCDQRKCMLTVHRLRASTTVDALRPMLLQLAVMDASSDPLFHRTTATLPPLNGPALKGNGVATLAQNKIFPVKQELLQRSRDYH
jgi:hypothetical protein